MAIVKLSTNMTAISSKIALVFSAPVDVTPTSITAHTLRQSEYNGQDAWPGLFIFKGTPPTNFSANVNTYDYATKSTSSPSPIRSSDRLLEITYHRDDLTAGGDYISFNLNEVQVGQASQSGTASWFIIDTTRSNSSGTRNTMKLMGTISTIGGGGDLVIANTSIVSGKWYAFGPMTINFPRNFSI